MLGDSVRSIPSFHATHPRVSCDVWFIDGGHERAVAEADAAAARAMSRRGALVIFDDVLSHMANSHEGGPGGPHDAWEALLASGAVFVRDTPGDVGATPSGLAVRGATLSGRYNGAMGWFT